MNSFIKKNINVIISIFILLGPILDMLTGLCLHTFNINFTIGIIVRVIFLKTQMNLLYILWNFLE